MSESGKELIAAVTEIAEMAKNVREYVLKLQLDNKRLKNGLTEIVNSKNVEGFHTRQAQALQNIAQKTLDG